MQEYILKEIVMLNRSSKYGRAIFEFEGYDKQITFKICKGDKNDFQIYSWAFVSCKSLRVLGKPVFKDGRLCMIYLKEAVKMGIEYKCSCGENVNIFDNGEVFRCENCNSEITML